MSLLIERRELLDRFKRGERRALEEVYRHYAPDVAAFLQRGFTFSSGGRAAALQRLRPAVRSRQRAAGDLRPRLQGVGARRLRRPASVQELPPRHRAQPGARRVPQPRGGDEPVHRPARRAAARPRRRRTTARRRRRRRPCRDGPSAGVSAEQEFLRQELGRLYAAFVARLDERDRTFFRHRFEEQQTQVEAGEACGLSHMQARTLEKKLRARLPRVHADERLSRGVRRDGTTATA